MRGCGLILQGWSSRREHRGRVRRFPQIKIWEGCGRSLQGTPPLQTDHTGWGGGEVHYTVYAPDPVVYVLHLFPAVLA